MSTHIEGAYDPACECAACRKFRDKLEADARRTAGIIDVPHLPVDPAEERFNCRPDSAGPGHEAGCECAACMTAYKDAMYGFTPRRPTRVAVIGPGVSDALDAVREALFVQLRRVQAQMTNEQRVEFWARLRNGYCPDCGRAVSGRCHCENDD